jgi:P-type conjugative transfer protein TrbJ
MKRRTLLLGLVATVAETHRAYAVFGVGDICANCATFAQQLIDYAKQAQQYLTEVSQLQTQMQQYATMIQNTVALPMSLWTQVQGDIQQVRGLANMASLLTGNAGGILNRLNMAGSYFNSLSMTPQQLSNQFSMWQTTLGNAGNSLARTLGVQQGQEQSYTALQSAIQRHSESAAGQMQAIQAGNESLGLMNTQLQQIHTTLVATAQEIATRDIVQGERDAAQDQATEKFLDHSAFTGQGAEQWR